MKRYKVIEDITEEKYPYTFSGGRGSPLTGKTTIISKGAILYEGKEGWWHEGRIYVSLLPSGDNSFEVPEKLIKAEEAGRR